MMRFTVAAFLFLSACVSASFCDLAAMAKELPQRKKQPREMLTLAAVELESGPAVEVRVGDIVFRADRLTVTHKDQPDTQIHALKGRVIVIRGDTKVSAQRMEVPIRNGGLSHDRQP